MTRTAPFRSGLLLATMLTAFAIAPRAAFAGNALQGAACTQGTDCASTFCVDGVCCDQACNDGCEACNLTGSVGTCSIVTAESAGDPSCAPYLCDGVHSGCPTVCTSNAACAASAFCDTNRARCVATSPLGTACTADEECESAACVAGVCCSGHCGDSGSSASTCTAAVCGPTTGYTCELPSGTASCRAESCINGVHTFSAVCDGAGNCGSIETQSCAPYACGTTACMTSCAVDTDCTAGSACDTSGQCVVGAVCSTVHTVQGIDGMTTDCSPYVCAGGVCMTACGNDEECIAGYACVNKSCALGDGGTEPIVTASSGCSASGHPTSLGNEAIAIVALLSFVGARRRRVAREET